MDFLTLGNGTEWLSRNVGTELPLKKSADLKYIPCLTDVLKLFTAERENTVPVM
jgi:hypothetical protein